MSDEEYIKYLGESTEYTNFDVQIPLTAQIAVVEAVLEMSPYLLANKRDDLLNHLHLITSYLAGVNNYGVLNFGEIYEYLGYTADAVREGKDPLTYPLAVESRERAEKELEQAKAFYKQKTKKNWGEH